MNGRVIDMTGKPPEPEGNGGGMMIFFVLLLTGMICIMYFGSVATGNDEGVNQSTTLLAAFIGGLISAIGRAIIDYFNYKIRK